VAPAKRSSTPVLIVRKHAERGPYFEAKWRTDGRQFKRRVGPAWMTETPDGGWKPRRGRVPQGTYDERSAHVRAAELVAAVERELDDEEADAERARRRPMTFRAMAHEWLDWLATVKGASPATVRDYACLLREPGHAHARGRRAAAGRIMSRFGDQNIREITAREISAFLRELDATTLTPRSVNKHRQLLSNVFTYASRQDTYAIGRNPAAQTEKRREPPAAALEYYEVHEVGLLARTIADGLHRVPATYDVGIDEQLARAAEDARDADLFRLLLLTGMRLGEIRALRWSDVDLELRTILVRRTVSAGIEKEPKGRRFRPVPLSRAAIDVLRRQAGRGEFVEPDDYVFCGRLGERLDDSAIRRRYKAACAAAGLRPIKLHGLRHAAGSLLARRGSSVEVRDFMGHAKLSTTDRYVSARYSEEFLTRLDEAFTNRDAVATTADSPDRGRA
jgi:integrase